MRNREFRAVMAAVLCMTAAVPLWAERATAAAQTPFLMAGGPGRPDVNPEDELAPSQMVQPVPPAVAEPTAAPSHKPARAAAVHAATGSAGAPGVAHTPAENPLRAAAAHTVVCAGPFARDSGNLSLAMAFDSRNVVFTDVDGGTGVGKVPASVVFPKDPKRRLEVWWSDPASRTVVDLIVINGQSTWSAPHGLRLGLNPAQVERLNHKPFKLKGFDANGIAAVSDWNGGALADIPGGCKIGVNLHADAKVSSDVLAGLPADREYSSDDPALRAAKPTVGEILIGY